MNSIDRLHLILAWAESEKSRDPSTRVGAVLVERNRATRHLRHNCFMSLHEPEVASRQQRYEDVLHAEERLMLELDPDAVAGATVYCTHEPCGRCWRLLAYMGVGRVVFNRTTPDRRERWGCQGGLEYATSQGVCAQEVVA